MQSLLPGNGAWAGSYAAHGTHDHKVLLLQLQLLPWELCLFDVRTVEIGPEQAQWSSSYT